MFTEDDKCLPDFVHVLIKHRISKCQEKSLDLTFLIYMLDTSNRMIAKKIAQTLQQQGDDSSSKSLRSLSLREKCQFARDAGIKETKDFVAQMEHRKAPEGFDIYYQGHRIGTTSKGFTRLGGVGWVNIFSQAEGLISQGSTKQSLPDALRAAADQLREREIKRAYESRSTI